MYGSCGAAIAMSTTLHNVLRLWRAGKCLFWLPCGQPNARPKRKTSRCYLLLFFRAHYAARRAAKIKTFQRAADGYFF
jgi:hypothetical protein